MQELEITYGEAVLTCNCDEPKQSVVRTVHKMQFTPDNLKTFWEKAKKYKTLFREEIRNDYTKFLSLILRDSGGTLQPTGLFYVVDDFVGVFYATDIKPEVDAVVHYSFFDGRHHGRVDLCLGMMSYFFQTFGFRRLTVELPMYATPKTHNFVAKSLGFKKEGRKRKAVKFNGEFFDVTIYGMLREDILSDGES